MLRSFFHVTVVPTVTVSAVGFHLLEAVAQKVLAGQTPQPPPPPHPPPPPPPPVPVASPPPPHEAAINPIVRTAIKPDILRILPPRRANILERAAPICRRQTAGNQISGA